nr:unnamed protein product [Callosobruchus analis]
MSKAVWNLLKRETQSNVNNTNKDSANPITEDFANYFSEIANNIVNQFSVNINDISDFLGGVPSPKNSFYLVPVSEDELCSWALMAEPPPKWRRIERTLDHEILQKWFNELDSDDDPPTDDEEDPGEK